MFDSTTRNRLAACVSDARRLLCGEYNKPGGEITSLLQTYGIQPDGTVADLDSLPGLDQRGYELASTLRDVLAHKRANTVGLKAWGKYDPHVYDLIQEQAFTVLNRLCALRMAEERGILPYPVISKGPDSDGFQVYEMVADKKHLGRDERYEAFLFSVFDELSLDLGVLFDRFSPHGMLFPRPDALGELLTLINDPALAPLWAEDETVGWIYQYWNSKDERKAMRDASAAPRNSRELAVRNQFFTPRYVVEFLTDNTLGRIWYEMCEGQTRLKDQCRYLVRRPNEIFLEEGEAPPSEEEDPKSKSEDPKSQEELLQEPVHIPHRPVKDPREIRLLDPACGSMHFGLYAFDLFEAIYEEAWDKGLCPALQEAYTEKADYLRDVPRLIIEHNIHGVDIDPRAVQIAGLSLWLRAQKTWKDTPATGRPRVRRSNIVCAEPMPGSDAMLEDFVQTLDPPLLGELVKTVFDKMQLAGEAGTLLKIEEEIRTAIDDAKAKWEKLGAAERDLFSAEELNQTLRPGAQQELTGVEKALTTDHRPLATDFFDTAEERIYAALRDYAESAEAGDYQRRLFAEDAAHGFAFIDLCRKRYDAVVMNPPFGRATDAVFELMADAYPASYIDIYCCFIEHALHCSPGGMVGAITSRSFLNAVTLEDFRTNIIPRTSLVVDLGLGVLDNALVEVAATVFKSGGASEIQVLDAQNHDPKEEFVTEAIEQVNLGLLPEDCFLVQKAILETLPKKQILYKFGDFNQAHGSQLEPAAATVRAGLNTFDNFRFVRCWWEVDSRQIGRGVQWEHFSKGGEFETFFDDVHLVIQRKNEGRELAAVNMLRNGQVAQSRQSHSRYYIPGLIYTIRSSRGFNVRHFPAGCVFSIKGPVIQATANTSLPFICAYLNSEPIRGLVEQQANANQFMPSIIKSLPWSDPDKELHDSVSSLGLGCILAKQSCYLQLDESPRFLWLIAKQGNSPSLKSLAADNNQRVARANDTLHKSSHEVSELLSEYLNFPKVDWSSEGISLEDHNLSQEPEVVKESAVAFRVVAFCIGIAFGRWDIRYATGERQPPALPDPFDPLPVCPPGMLQNADGLPAAKEDVPDHYPLSITWPGILVSDPGHPEDIVARVRDALAVIWGDRASAIEQEACEILGVRTLRDYFAEKRSGGKFFKDHLKRYSKSRRQAPIYWPLSTESGTYTLWIYYHRLTEDTLYACITNFVAPKQEQAEKTLARLAAKGDARTKAEDKEYEQTEALIGELATFRAELERLAKIWKPNLNDGVQITAAPLWNLFRLKPWQKKLKDTWDKLEAGDYDWAHLAHTLWPERVIPKCATDRSLAIAHGYEEDLWEEVENDKGKLVWQPKEDAGIIAQKLIGEGKD